MIFLFGLNFQKISYTYHCGWVRWIGEGWENFSFHYPLEVKFGFGRIFLRFLFSTLLWRLEMRFDESAFPITHLDTISHFSRKNLKYFFLLPNGHWNCVLAKTLKFFEKNCSLASLPRKRNPFFCFHLHQKMPIPTTHWKRDRILNRISENFFPHLPLRMGTAFWRRYLKNISTFPTGHENPIWPNFFEKIIIFIPLYLSWKNVNPHQWICRCHQRDKNDKVYQGQIPKVLLGKISIKIHKKKFKNWPWYTLHTAAWVNLDEPLLPKVLLGDFFKNLLRESLYNDLNRG